MLDIHHYGVAGSGGMLKDMVKAHLRHSGGENKYDWYEVMAGRHSLPTSQDASKVYLKIFDFIHDLYYQIVFQLNPGILAKLMERELPAIIDEKTWIAFTSDKKAHDSRIMELHKAVIAAFETEPLEDGYCHPAEHLIERAINEIGDEALSLLYSMVLEQSRHALGASILRCLGRLSISGREDWRTSIVSEALKSRQVELRDAAIQAAEQWGGTLVIEALKKHPEPVPWLRDYMERVIYDLTSRYPR